MPFGSREHALTRGQLTYALAGVTLVSTLTACGSGQGFITTPEALSAFRQAGFANVAVRSNKKAYADAARQ